MAEKWHSGITLHKLTVGPGIMGLLFAVGCALIFVIGLPALWSFVALSSALGLAIAFFFRLVSRHRSDRHKPLSIFEATEPLKAKTEEKHRTLRNALRPALT